MDLGVTDQESARAKGPESPWQPIFTLQNVLPVEDDGNESNTCDNKGAPRHASP